MISIISRERTGEVEGVDRLIGVVGDELGEIDAEGRFVEAGRHGAEPHHERREHAGRLA